MKQYEKDGLIIGGIYRHYKGGMYRVLDVGTFTEPYLHYEDATMYEMLAKGHFADDVKMVVYRSIEKDPETRIRPLNMFKEVVMVDLDNGGKDVSRFEFVE